jgi:phospholipid N-methyltransferase
VEVGAFAPSGPQLAERVVEAADLRAGQAVVELGAGTGPVTKAILAAVPDASFLAFEPNPEMAAVLRRDFPGLRVSEKLAHEMPGALAEWGHPRVDRIVSGLPWALWPNEVQEPVMEAIVDALKPGGRMVTFTYVHSQVFPNAARMRRLLQHYFGRVTRSKISWANLPPAFVWVCDEPRR